MNFKHQSYITQLGIFTLIYFAALKLTLYLIGHPAPIWPPAGIALGIILLFGYRLSPCIAIGTALVMIHEGSDVTLIFTEALGNTVEALLGAYLLKSVGFRSSLERVMDVLELVIIGAAVGIISATIDSVYYWSSGNITTTFGAFWARMWVGEMLGIIVVSPVIFTLGSHPRFDFKPARAAEAIVLLVALVFISLTTLGEPMMIKSPYLMFPLLIWAALRFGQPGATLAIIIVSSIAIWLTVSGHSHFIREKPEGGIYFLQIFTGVISLTILILAAVITERRKTEEELQASDEKLRRMFEQANDAIFIISKEGKITFVNARACDMLRFSKEELCSMNFSDIMPPGFETEIEDFKKRLKTGGTLVFETQNRRKDGSLVNVECSISPVHLKDEDVLEIFARDITERKKAYELQLENTRLEAADRAKSEFLASMSHELRTPLNSIIGFSEILNRGIAGKLDEKQKHFIGNILASGTFLLSLINDILDLSKIEAGKIELVREKMSLPVTIKETLTLMKEKAFKHNVSLKTEFDPELGFMDVDKQRFKQILFNLLSNAVKFSKEEGGTITIKTEKEGDMARISVSDTGIGIKDEKMGKIFNKFDQLEPGISKKYGGTGLGLAITKQLVELHGGTITAKSIYGEGSTFMFTLPLKKP